MFAKAVKFICWLCRRTNFQSVRRSQTRNFCRYIDDCLGATSCTKEELERFTKTCSKISQPKLSLYGKPCLVSHAEMQITILRLLHQVTSKTPHQPRSSNTPAPEHHTKTPDNKTLTNLAPNKQTPLCAPEQLSGRQSMSGEITKAQDKLFASATKEIPVNAKLRQ